METSEQHVRRWILDEIEYLIVMTNWELKQRAPWSEDVREMRDARGRHACTILGAVLSHEQLYLFGQLLPRHVSLARYLAAERVRMAPDEPHLHRPALYETHRLVCFAHGYASGEVLCSVLAQEGYTDTELADLLQYSDSVGRYLGDLPDDGTDADAEQGGMYA